VDISRSVYWLVEVGFQGGLPEDMFRDRFVEHIRAALTAGLDVSRVLPAGGGGGRPETKRFVGRSERERPCGEVLLAGHIQLGTLIYREFRLEHGRFHV